MTSSGLWKTEHMNIINKAFLKVALLPAVFYKKAGINTHQLKSILVTKLTLDDRRPNTIQQTSSKKSEKPVSMATIGTMFISAVIGLMYLFAFMMGSDNVTHLVFYFSMFFVMLSSTLISDFTSVLIDVRDNYIILPKPVTDRTFMAARLLHIFIHICKIVLPMSLPGIMMMGIRFDLAAALIFLLLVMMVTLFTIFFINAIYILILKITTPQRFQSIISYVQVIFAIVIFASYQLLPRVVDEMGLAEFSITTQNWVIFYPIYWFANVWEVLYHLDGNTESLIMAILGLVLPVISIYIVVKYLAPSFNNRLAMINSSANQEPQQKEQVRTEQRKFSYADFLSRMFTRSKAERMGFLFAWKMSSRSRDFRMKVYPSIGYLLVYVVLIVFRGKSFDLDSIRNEEGPGRFLIISALYISSFVLVMAITQIIYSEKYKAAWIYYVTPLKKPGEVILGGALAAIMKFYIPIVLLITIFGLVLVGPSILPNIILGLFNELLIVTLMVYVGKRMFPFSLHQNTNVKAGSFMKNLLVISISGIIAMVHYFLYPYTIVIIILAVLSILATWLMMASIRNSSWESIKSTYSDH